MDGPGSTMVSRNRRKKKRGEDICGKGQLGMCVEETNGREAVAEASLSLYLLTLLSQPHTVSEVNSTFPVSSSKLTTHQ